MNTRKLTSTDGFLIVDLPDADSSVGPARLGEKLIASNAGGYAREITYGFGLLGERRGGATLGLKSAVDDRDDAVAAAAAELADELSQHRLVFDSGLRMPPASLKALSANDPRPPERGALGDELEAAAIVAAVGVLVPELGGAKIAIDSVSAVTAAAAKLLESAGASIVRVGSGKDAFTGTIPARAIADTLAGDENALSAHGEAGAAWTIWKSDGIDVAIAGAKVGALTDQGAQLLGDTPVVCHGVAPVATKAIATSRRAGGRIIPAFVTGLGRRVIDTASVDSAAEDLRGRAADAVSGALERALAADSGPYVGACIAAEEFITSWAENAPFGRPMA